LRSSAASSRRSLSSASRPIWSGAGSWSIDATKVLANASLESVGPRFAVEAHLTALFGESEASTSSEGDENGGNPGGGPEESEAAERAPVPLPPALAEEDRAALAEHAATRHDGMREAGQPHRGQTSGAYRRTADVRASATDPDAALMPTGVGRTHPGSQPHDVVDGGRARIVLVALVAPAEVQENQPALDLRWRARFRWKLHPRQVVGEPQSPGPASTSPPSKISGSGPPFRSRRSASGPANSRSASSPMTRPPSPCRCPGGEPLHVRSQSDVTLRRIDPAPASACTACTLRAQCTTSPRGRRGGRSFAEEEVERVRGDHDTEAYAKAMRKRTVWVEPLFAEAKDWHGLRRFRLRGLPKVNGEALVIAAGQNLKRLLSKRDWGRRPWPDGAAGVALPARPELAISLP
jgi:hypothetical protein